MKKLQEIITTNEETLRNLCVNIASGSSLNEIATLWEVQYYELWEWISTDAARYVCYETALKQREDFFKMKLIDELKYIAFSDLRKIYSADGTLLPMNQWPADVATAVAELDESPTGARKAKMNSKMKAIEMLGKELVMFVNRIDVTQKTTIEDLINQSAETPVEADTQKNDDTASTADPK
jgi:hypothetical protein